MKFKNTHTYWLLLLASILLCANAGNVHARRRDMTAEYFDGQIKRLYQAQKVDSMKIVIEEALGMYPDDTDINRWAGTYFLQKNETDNARYFLIKAVTLDSENYLAKQQLVNLEEQLGNISSAICYVNEMLELFPYDKALWKKKAGLYRKQGNDIEADRLTRRLCTIYPEDSTVMADYTNRLEEIYIGQRREGRRNDAITTLEELIGLRNDEAGYYLDLGNLLLQEGRSEEASAAISRGLERFPDDTALLKKKAEIMAGRGESKEAVSLLQKSRYSSLYQTADELMIEAARNESWYDPYTLYGRIYETNKSEEALDYLIRTSISREYNDDALYYLSEYRKMYGAAPEVSYREYRVFRRTGDRKSAIRALEEYISAGGQDTDMEAELAYMKIEIADELMTSGKFSEAVPYLESALTYTSDTETENSARNKLLSCYLETNRNSKATAFIDSLRNNLGDRSLYTEQKALALHQSGKSGDAMAEMEANGMTGSETYGKISIEYIKALIEAGATKKAYATSTSWVENEPQSMDALTYAISTSEAAGAYEDADRYIAAARKIYPDETVFVLKEAASLYRKKEYLSGIALLEPLADSLSGNDGITSAYSAHAGMQAQEYLYEKEPDKALSLISDALAKDSDNQELLLLQGEAYEMKKDYAAAYASYSGYKPEPLWARDYRRKLMAVQNKGYKNEIATNVLNGWYSDGSRTNTLISTSYSRKMKRDYITATLNLSYKNYIQDEETQSDYTGVQLRADWGHTFNNGFSSVLGAAVSNGIFPTWLGQAGIYYMLPADIEFGLVVGYRRNYTPADIVLGTDARSGDMFNFRLSGNVYDELWRINTNLDAYVINRKAYFNLNSQFKYYPGNDPDTHFMLSAGVGTAPEIDFVDRLMPGSFENLNVSLGIGGMYMISKNISLGITASYHYFYNMTGQTSADEGGEMTAVTLYRNLYDINAQIIFSF